MTRQAAPLQALGTNAPRQRAGLFEDEDDDENDSLGSKTLSPSSTS